VYNGGLGLDPSGVQGLSWNAGWWSVSEAHWSWQLKQDQVQYNTHLDNDIYNTKYQKQVTFNCN